MAVVEDEEAFLIRLSSFQVETWFAKPDALTPALCASFGWSNIAPDRLQCSTCKATLQYTSQTDVLATDDDREVEEFVQNLEWEHDADCIWCEEHCPIEFLTIRMQPTEKAFQDLAVRYKRLSAVWDLPKLDVSILQDGGVLAKLERLGEKLYEEWRQSVMFLTTESEALTESLRLRTSSLTLLALLGWDLMVMDYCVEQETNVEGMTVVRQKPIAARPEGNGYCCARQSVLCCERCTACIGLWSYPSVAHVPLDLFKEVSRKWTRDALQIVVDRETGEVQDLFRRLYAAEDIETRAPEVKPTVYEESGQKEGSAIGLKRSLSLDREAVASRPVFGLQCLKKQKLQPSSSLTLQPSLSLEEAITSGLPLNPLEEHRFSCSYRKQWQDPLNALLPEDDPV